MYLFFMERDNKQGTKKITFLLELIDPAHILVIGVQQLDIVKFALPFEKIFFHPIFSTVGKHTNFFEAFQAASRPQSVFSG